MGFQPDHDLHIHSYLSACSRDPEHYALADFIVIPTTHLNMMGLALNKAEGSSVQSRATELFKKAVDALSLEESDKFHLRRD